MKRTFAMLTLLAMLLCGTAAAEMPDYLNPDSEFPIVKEGEEITLSIAVMPNVLDNVEDLWFWEYCRQVMNIDFEITAFTSDMRDEKINLMFAADTLPDMIVGCDFSTAELVRYGQVEGQLLALNDYLTEEYAPNILKLFAEYPEYQGIVTALDGNIYSLPSVNPPLNILGLIPANFINTRILAETSMEMPSTLDELYQVLRKMKELYPDSIPMGGGVNAADPSPLIWSALGVTTTNAIEPGFKNGEVTVLCGDEMYGEYLAFMHKLYSEGLIDPDYYTIDSTMLNGELAEGRVFISPVVVYNALPNGWDEWVTIPPLTSEFNDTQVWPSAPLARPGAAVINSQTEYPELCMRFLDFFFTEKGGIYAWTGPLVGSEDCLGMVSGWYGNEQSPDVEAGKYSSVWEYVVYEVSPFNPNRPGTKAGEVERIHFIDPEADFEWELTNPENYFRASKETAVYPYLVDAYPTIYFDEETQQRISELKLVLEDYVNTESAKFITGVNSLDNLPAYFEQLNDIGFEEYLTYYVDAYEIYLANLQ